MNEPTRRDALRAFGAGLLVAFAWPGAAEAIEPADPTIFVGGAPPKGGDAHLDAYVRIAPDGVVTLRMPAAEMGQGVYTSLPMLLAEELDCDWRQVRAESAPTHADYNRPLGYFGLEEQLTGGSFSVRNYWGPLRKAGATARAMLVAEAAARWGVDVATCQTKDGVVTSGELRATYGELAEGAAGRKPPKDVALKDPATFRLLGTSPARLDVPSKVDGSAVFGVDVKVEGMAQGTVIPNPHYGGKLRRVDDTKAKAMPGVVGVYAYEQEVVVVAERFWQAKKAADALIVEWDPGEGAGLDDARIDAALTAGLEDGGKTIQREGPRRVAGETLTAEYAVPYLDHATMEPMSGAARVAADRVDVWAGTQAQTRARRAAAEEAGVGEDQVFVHTTMLGGGFGRRSEMDFVRIPVRVAKDAGRPVKLIWTREATFARGAYRPAAKCRLHATLADGKIQRLHATVAASNILARFVPNLLANGKAGSMIAVEGLAEGPYHFPSIQVDYARVDLPITTGWWRSVHGSFNGFFRECFLDECAAALSKDPVELRRELLAHNPRFRAVLDLAVEKAGPALPGHGRGVAIFESFGSILAHVADVAVVDGTVKVARFVAAIDCGRIVHPDTIRAQVMGATTMGLSMTLGEKLSFQDGAAREGNFHTYPLLFPAQAPPVEVHIVPSTEPSGGVGEPGLPPTPAAVVNAIFAVTGKRVRSLPVRL